MVRWRTPVRANGTRPAKLSVAEIRAARDSARWAGRFAPAIRVEPGYRSTAPGASILPTCSDLTAAHDRRNLSAAEIGAAGDSAKSARPNTPAVRVGLGCRSTAPSASILPTCSDPSAAHDRRILSAAELRAARDSAKSAGPNSPALRVDHPRAGTAPDAPILKSSPELSAGPRPPY